MFIDLGFDMLENRAWFGSTGAARAVNRIVNIHPPAIAPSRTSPPARVWH
jgi:hypothetical protein